MEMMIAGMMKRRIEKYKDIVLTLLDKKDISEEQKEFLIKEKVIK